MTELEKQNKQLKQQLWLLVLAQGRMLDKYSEGDDTVKQKLWTNLHSAGIQAREYLESIGSKVNQY